jgi:hypothetical protein
MQFSPSALGLVRLKIVRESTPCPVLAMPAVTPPDPRASSPGAGSVEDAAKRCSAGECGAIEAP